MRNLLPTALLALLVSCGSLTRGVSGPSLAEVRESTYQVQVSLNVDISALLPPDEEEGGDDKDLNFEMILDRPEQRATGAHVVSRSNNIVELNWVGTGWTVDRRAGRSFVMTAGHVCETERFYSVKVFDWDTGEVKTVELPIVSRSHNLVSRDNVKVAASVVRDEDLDKDFDGIDLCLMGAMADLGRPLAIADSDPVYGDRAEVVGGPRGLWGGGVAVASDVKFTGRGSVFGVNPAGLAFNGEVAPGNSGSAVVYRGEVVGLISLAAIRFPSLCHAVPHGTIRGFLQRALPTEE